MKNITLESLSAMFADVDTRVVHIAQLEPRLVLDIFDERSQLVEPLPRRVAGSRRERDMAVRCGVFGDVWDPPRIRHAEWQSRAAPRVPYRMVHYTLDLHETYRLPIACAVLYGHTSVPADERKGWLEVAVSGPFGPWRIHYRVIIVPEIDATTWIDPRRPTLATFVPFCRGGTEMANLRGSLRILCDRIGSAASRIAMLSLHFVLAELRCAGATWRKAAAMEGIKYNDALETDEIFQSAVRRFQMERDAGFDEGRNAGFDEGKDVGFDEGKDVGFDEGKDVGFDEGKNVGSRLTVLALAESLLGPAASQELAQISDAQAMRAELERRLRSR